VLDCDRPVGRRDGRLHAASPDERIRSLGRGAEAMAMTIETPRSHTPAKKRTNWEKWGWVYMRVSGVLLVVLIFGHLFSNLMVGDGVAAIDFGFVGGKLASPF